MYLICSIAALRGNGRSVAQMIRSLQRTQDPYMTFGLLSSQVFQLAVLAVGDKPSTQVAADIGAHPYALSKLSSHAKRLGRSGARKIIAVYADADAGLLNLLWQTHGYSSSVRHKNSLIVEAVFK